MDYHHNPELRHPDISYPRHFNGVHPDKRFVQEEEPPEIDDYDQEDAIHNGDEPLLPRLHAGTLDRTLSLMPKPTSPFDSVLISYFEKVICSSSTLLDDERYNPYRHVLLPMAFQSPGIYPATLAISANTLRLARPEYRVRALEHKQQALKALISIVKRRPSSNGDIDEMMGLILMLCWFEINVGCRPSWVKHLSGFRSLIRHHDENMSSRSAYGQSFEKFFLQYFAFHLVLAKTAFRVDEFDLAGDSDPLETPIPPSSPLSTSPLPSCLLTASSPINDHDEGFSFSPSTSFLSCYMPLETLDEIDPYMGFSNALLLLINEIADLAESQSPQSPTFKGSLDEDQAKRLQTRSLRLKAGLEELEQRLPSTATSGQELAMRTPAVLATAEAYRLGALLLLYEVTSVQGGGRLWVNCVISRGERTRDGTLHKADVVVLAAGAWTDTLLDLGGQLTAKGHSVAHIQLTPTQQRQYADMPIMDSLELGYYFPPGPDGVFKMAHSNFIVNTRPHPLLTGSPVSIPHTFVKHPTDDLPLEIRQVMRDNLRRVFPDLATLPFSHTRLCWDADTTDRHFLITPVPQHPNLFLAAGGSAHGFKFMPVLGKYIADMLEGTLDPDIACQWAWRPGYEPQKRDFAHLYPEVELKDLTGWKGVRKQGRQTEARL